MRQHDTPDHQSSHSSLDAALADLRDDRRAGAAELLRRAGGLFTRLRADQATVANLTNAQEAILATAVRLVRAQPDMAPLARLADSAIRAALSAADAAEAFHLAEQAALEFIALAARRADQAAAHAADLIGDHATVLTHSRSSTVLTALRHARRAGRSFRVIVTESRPLMEGRILAGALADESLDVTYIADAAAALVMPRADCVLVGADRVTPEWLINKIGTRMIALAARERHVKMIALCDTSKFVAGWPAPPEAARAADELWPDAPSRVEIVNLYFEPTPLDCLDGVVTEDGLLAPREVSRRAAGQPISPPLLAALAGL